MTKRAQLTAVEIASRLKSKKDFLVIGPSNRQRVLTAAKYLGFRVVTRKNEGDTFTVAHI